MSITEPDVPRVMPPPPASGPPQRHRWVVLVVIGLAQLMVVLDATAVNIMLPSAQADLGFSDVQRQWIVTAYSLAFGSLLLLGGRIADLFGRKITFLVGLAGFAAASGIAGAAENFAQLVAARAGQGVFGALLAPAALSLLTTTFTDGKERAKAFSVYAVISGAGGAMGLLLGGVLTEYFTWRWALYVNLIFAAVAFAGGLLLLNRTARDKTATLDIPGTVLVTGGLFCIVYAFSNAGAFGWSHPLTWGFMAAGAALLAAFTWWQTKAAHPMLPLRILLDRNRGSSLVSILIASAAMFGMLLFLTYYLQNSMGYSPIQSGLALLPMIAALMIGAFLGNNLLVPRIGPKPVVPLGMALTASGLVWMSTLDLSASYTTQVLPTLLVAGTGMGMVISPAVSLGIIGVDPRDAGAASAALNAIQQIGGSIGTALLNTVSASAASNYLIGKNAEDPVVLAQSSLEGYHSAFLWSAGFFAIGLVVSALLYPRGVPKQTGPFPM